eukprot:m.468657 g.468657  ORF g.468657 m.468657 type:complete len:188 (+) comp57079_c0_seq3:1245-1808(+)
MAGKQSELEEQVQRVLKELDERDQIIGELQSQVDRALRDKRSAELLIEQLRSVPSEEVACLKSSNEHLQTQLATAFRTLEQTKMQNELGEAQSKNMRADFDKQLATKDAEVQDLQRRVQSFLKSSEETKDVNARLLREVEEIRQQMKTVQAAKEAIIHRSQIEMECTTMLSVFAVAMLQCRLRFCSL